MTARYVQGMERLVRAVQDLSLAHDLPAVQDIVRHAAREMAGCDGATFVLRDRGKCYYADEDAIAPLWKGQRFPMDACISGWAMIHHQPAVIPDIYADSRIPADAYRPTFVKSLAMVPIRTTDPIGAIGTYWAHAHHASADEVALLQALADTAAVAIENIRVHAELEQRVRDRTQELEQANVEIHRLSLTDELTALHNRRGFYLLAEQALKSSRRNGRQAHLVYIDLDGVKPINDRFGHEAGDALIIDAARAIVATFRVSDVIGRVGGDEFCILMLDNGLDPEALRRRLDQKLAECNAPDKVYRLSASMGVATASFEGEDLDALIDRADQAMYADKRGRRSRLPTPGTELPGERSH